MFSILGKQFDGSNWIQLRIDEKNIRAEEENGSR